MQTTTTNNESVLVLRACNSDMSSKNGFIWPTSGPVECPDWKPTNECGNGLHGWPHGHGDGGTSRYWVDDCKWLVVEVKTKHIIDLDGKVKFKKGTVVFCGDQKAAIDYLLANDHIASTKPVIGAMITTGDHGTSVSGDYGTSTSGIRGTSISGDYGTSTSGDDGTSTSGYGGTSIAGDYGTSTSGDRGTSTSGNCGTSTSGYNGKSTSGNCGTSTSGRYGKSTSGENGTIIIKYCKNGRYYSKVGHIGEDGLEPNVAYKLDEKHNFIEVIA